MPARLGQWSRALPWGLAALALAFAVIVGLRTQSTLAPTTRFVQIDARVSGEASLVANQGPAAVLSPDGSLLALVAFRPGQVRQLFGRRLDQLEAAPLSGTEDAESPFFSPDGQWLAFFATGKLKKVPATGGTVVTLCDAPVGRGGTWSDEGWIAFTSNASSNASLLRVSDAGGVPERLTTLGEGQVTHRWPQVLPRARGVLYSTSKNLGNYNDGDIVVQPFPTGAPKTLVSGGYFGRYLASGHLTYVHDGRLFAVAVDLDRLELAGSPIPVLESVARSVSTGAAQFAFSDTGTAVYLPGGASAPKPLQWLSRDGRLTTFSSSPVDWSNPRASSSGDRLAVDIYDGQQTDVWVYDRDSDAPKRLTFDRSEDWTPLWTPDDNRIVFRGTRESSAFNLFWQRADGGGTAERLTNSVNPQTPSSWHPSGRVLAFVEMNPMTNSDIMLLRFRGADSAESPTAPTPLLNTPAAENSPEFSPDGRWVAYVSNESGQNGVYVRPYPSLGGQWLVAPEGSYPTWSRARRELVFLGPDQQLMVSTYNVEGDSFRAGTPHPWSSVRAVVRPRGNSGSDGRAFDLHPDGERAIGAWITDSETVAPQNSVVLAFNFFDELRRLAPVKRRRDWTPTPTPALDVCQVPTVPG